MRPVLVPILGRSISLLGSWILFISAGQTVYADSQSAVLVGLLAVARLVPSVLLGPAIAPRIQRVNKWALMSLLDAVGAACMFAISVRPNALSLFVASVFLSGVSAVYLVAYRSAIPTLVSSDKLMRVNAIRTALSQTSVALGPIMAGAALSIVGASFAAAINGFTFLVSGGAMAYTALANKAATGDAAGAPPAGARRSSVRDSIAAVMGQPLLRGYFAASVFAGLGYGVLHHLVVYANSVLLGGEAAYGTLLSALGAGGLLSLALLLIPVGRIKPFVGYAVALLLDATAFLLLGALRLSTIAAAAALFLSGGNDALATMSSETIIQRHAPADSSAQAFALDAALSRLATPVGILLVGVLADSWGMRAAFSVSAALLGAAAAYVFLVCAAKASSHRKAAQLG